MDMVTETPFSDLWFERGKDGELIPFYFGRIEEEAAIAAFLSGDWGSLTTEEIEFMKEARKEMYK